MRRDSFARTEIIRHKYKNIDRKACAWCGQVPKTLYAYEVESDSGKRYGKSRLVCNLRCYDAFYR